MTFQPAFAVDGGPINGLLIRRQLQSATRGEEGVVELPDMAVRPLAVPGTGLIIGDGAAVIRGRDTAWDGSYYALNVGDTTVSDVTGTGSGGGRTDMVVVRIQPGAVVEPYIIQGVPADATSIAETPEPNLSAIPLARIAWPASTGTITAGMLTDIRPMLNPRQARVSLVQRGGTQSQEPGQWDEAGNITAYFERWPQHAWQIRVPAWARYMQMSARWSQTWMPSTGSDAGTEDARGLLRVRLFNDTTELLTTPGSYNINHTSPTNGQRITTIEVGQEPRPVPAGLRGTTATVWMMCQGTAGQDGRLVADEWSSYFIDLDFSEQPLPSAAL